MARSIGALPLAGSDLVESGTATQLQVTGLDMSQHAYLIQWKINSAATHTGKMSLNAEGTETGYSRGTAAKVTTSNSGAITGSISTGGGASGLVIAYQAYTTAGNVVWTMHHLNTSSLDIVSCVKSTGSPTAHGTSVELYSSVAGGFDVNTFLNVYRLF